MTEKQRLVDYVLSLTEEQVDKIVLALDLLNKCIKTPEAMARYVYLLKSKELEGEEVVV